MLDLNNICGFKIENSHSELLPALRRAHQGYLLRKCKLAKTIRTENKLQLLSTWTSPPSAVRINYADAKKSPSYR